MIYIETEPGVRIYVEDLNPGGDRTVLFIHGWPLNHHMFEYQLDQLPKYGFRCISLDLRGFGRSDHPWQGYNYNRLADDIRVIIDAMGLRYITLAGFSVGGAVAIRYMSRHRGHGVSRLALLAAAAPSFTKQKGYPFGQTKEEINRQIMQLYTDRPKLLKEFGRKFFATRLSPEFEEWFLRMGLEASGHGTINTSFSLRDEDLGGDLPHIRVPTAIFHGEQDRIVPVQSAEALQRNIPGSMLYRFRASGHGVFYDELDKFNSAFLDFVSGKLPVGQGIES
ncbi:alpha/beta fold hydrolase [Paenibacillus tuaregi]|uniref:alpha/beta fold hydrolase n=1 Tax=Paenibacillus tuaregi TaxID=1816681 RepID=UPI000837D3CD|nr:alpha/beta hydrolase [Paenibacillus tuaregi]